MRVTMTRLSKVVSCMTRRHKSASDVAPPPSKCAEDGVTGATGQSLAEEGEMKACLTTFDLVSLGVGSCLGTGMYLTAGLVASTMAGPGGVLSLFLAGAASILTGLCYAELAGLCPKTSGSAYMYAYITVGELVAFVIGWGLVVEYVIGTAAGAVALSETLDSLSGDLLASYTTRIAGIVGVPKVDVVAATICVLLTLLLASGAEMSAKVNNGLNITNVVVLVFFVIASALLGSSRNWVAGSFFPYGLTGVVGAIPTCYFAYIGFDTVAATGAEAQNPSKAVPRSILLSILFNCLAYVIVIMALTFDLPFYMLPHDTAMTDVFPRLNFAPGKYIVAVGAVSGEFAATFGSMFPLPRVLAAMAEDGLIFRQLGKICPKRQTPVRATLLSGFVAMVMATFFNLQLLIELVLIGTLLAYVLVTFALLYVRYVPENHDLDSVDPVLKTGSAEEGKPYHAERKNIDNGNLGGDGRRESVESEELPSRRTHSPNCIESEEIAPKGRYSSTYQRLGVLPRKQPNMGRSEYSATSKRVTFSPSLHIHSDSSGRLKFGARSIVPDEHTAESTPQKRQNSREKDSKLQTEDLRVSLEKSRTEQDREIYLDDLELQEQEQQRLLSGTHPLEDLDKNDKSEKLDLRDFLTTSPHGKTNYNSLPLWLKIVTDIVNWVSASTNRILCLLEAIYVIEILICVLLSKTWKAMADGSIVSLGLLGILSGIFLVLVGIVTFLPQRQASDAFRAPLVPALPVFVAFINIYLMTSLSPVTWLLFGLWMSLGVLIYLLYGVSHSQAGDPTDTYTPLPSTEVSVVLDDNDDDDNDDEERSLLHD